MIGMTLLEPMDCGCCAIAWMLVPVADDAMALLGTLIPLGDPDPDPELAAMLAGAEPADGRDARLAALRDVIADANRAIDGAEESVTLLASAAGDEDAMRYLADDAVLRQRAIATWYGDAA